MLRIPANLRGPCLPIAGAPPSIGVQGICICFGLRSISSSELLSAVIVAIIEKRLGESREGDRFTCTICAAAAVVVVAIAAVVGDRYVVDGIHRIRLLVVATGGSWIYKYKYIYLLRCFQLIVCPPRCKQCSAVAYRANLLSNALILCVLALVRAPSRFATMKSRSPPPLFV